MARKSTPDNPQMVKRNKNGAERVPKDIPHEISILMMFVHDLSLLFWIGKIKCFLLFCDVDFNGSDMRRTLKNLKKPMFF